MFVLGYPKTGPIVLDFPISLALRNGGAQSIDFGFANWRKLGLYWVGPTYDQFQNITASFGKFCENLFKDIENLWTEKKKNKYHD